jgi:hypothetical protein
MVNLWYYKDNAIWYAYCWVNLQNYDESSYLYWTNRREEGTVGFVSADSHFTATGFSVNNAGRSWLFYQTASAGAIWLRTDNSESHKIVDPSNPNYITGEHRPLASTFWYFWQGQGQAAVRKEIVSVFYVGRRRGGSGLGIWEKAITFRRPLVGTPEISEYYVGDIESDISEMHVSVKMQEIDQTYVHNKGQHRTYPTAPS